MVLAACNSDNGGSEQRVVDNTSSDVSTDMRMDNMQSMTGMSGMASGEVMPEADDLGQAQTTDNNFFRVIIIPDIDPLPLNQMHGWVLSLHNETGAPVSDAEITVEGGMPAHNHGMPTSPQVVENLGNGRYQIEGVQFQMPGHWVVTFNITSGGQTDSVTYNLMLQP